LIEGDILLDKDDLDTMIADYKKDPSLLKFDSEHIYTWNIHFPVKPWVHTVLLFSPTCSFIRMRQTSYREKRKEASPIL
jgi:hypothetical protein